MEKNVDLLLSENDKKSCKTPPKPHGVRGPNPPPPGDSKVDSPPPWGWGPHSPWGPHGGRGWGPNPNQNQLVKFLPQYELGSGTDSSYIRI